MARNITEIKKTMTDAFIANEEVQARYGIHDALTFEEQFSKVSIESILFYVMAVALYIQEVLFDKREADINAALDTRLTHNAAWYVRLAKAFQRGHQLPDGTSTYAVVDPAAQVVTHAAVTEKNAVLYLKVATTRDGELSPLPNTPEEPVLDAFAAYIAKAKDAGVKVVITSATGDDLKLVLDIWYDPLVLDGNGNLLNSPGVRPVEVTVRHFIKSLRFNGEFRLDLLTDALQATTGVVIPTVVSAESRHAQNPFEVIDAKVIPYAGYLVIDGSNLTVKYRAYEG